MKTSYQRELKRNYLIVEMEKSDTRGEPPFEQKMLEQNQIDGILRFQVRQKDEEIRFFYEITSNPGPDTWDCQVAGSHGTVPDQ